MSRRKEHLSWHKNSQTLLTIGSSFLFPFPIVSCNPCRQLTKFFFLRRRNLFQIAYYRFHKKPVQYSWTDIYILFALCQPLIFFCPPPSYIGFYSWVVSNGFPSQHDLTTSGHVKNLIELLLTTISITSASM